MATATTKILDSIEYTVPFPSTEPNLLIRSLYSLPSSPPPSSPLKRTIPDPRLPHDSLLISVTVFQNSTQQTGSPTHGVKKGKFDLGGGGSSDFTYYSKPLLPPPFSAKEDDSGDRENGAETYVLTFGSGNSLPGFDLGLVGAREGDVREILIPPKLAFASYDLKDGYGPKPRSVTDLRKLAGLVEELRDGGMGMGTGTGTGGSNKLILSVRVNWVIEDESDQGFFNDQSVSAEEFAEARKRFGDKGRVPETENVKMPGLASPLSPGRG